MEFFTLLKKNDVLKCLRMLKENPLLAEDCDDERKTPLHWACQQDLTNMAEVLIDFGAPMFAKDDFSRKPYDEAVAFAHGGGSFPATLARIKHGFDVRPDLCAIDNKVSPEKYMGKFWLDSLVHDPKMLDYIVSLVGEKRVALGTDYPFPLGELTPGKLINSMPWSQERKGNLLHGAALEWLNLDLSKFI